ncbi:MAG: alpha/beta hydrolase [Methanosarcinales archaeon]|nr:alpha/beta hydrolase [Methanosarcinales archaeon]
MNFSQVAVVGVSRGGPSSLQFALRHPDRCSALVMISAIRLQKRISCKKLFLIRYSGLILSSG